MSTNTTSKYNCQIHQENVDEPKFQANTIWNTVILSTAVAPYKILIAASARPGTENDMVGKNKTDHDDILLATKSRKDTKKLSIKVIYN